jgi:hypothetical protein
VIITAVDPQPHRRTGTPARLILSSRSIAGR